MDKLTRRTLLRALAGGTLATAGTIVLARATLAEASEATTNELALEGRDVQERAARLAEGEVDVDEVSSRFRNAAFRNGGGRGAFRNSAFRNGGGGFLNGGGFRNGGGAFRNGRFRNF